MPRIEQYREWIEKTRPLLGMGDARKMTKRNDEVAGVLTEMEKLVKSDATEYDVTGSKENYDEFKKNFLLLKKEFENLAGRSLSNPDKTEAEKIANELRKLKQKVRLALGSVRPTQNPKVKQQLLKSARQKPIYEDRKKQFEKTLKELQGIPGTKTQQKTLTDCLKEAEKRLPDYDDAIRYFTFYTDLSVQQGEGLENLRKDAKEATQNLPDTLFDEAFGKLFRGAEAKLREFSKIAPISMSADVDEFDGELQKILSEGEDQKIDVVKAKSEVQKIVDQLTKGIEDVQKAAKLITKPKGLVEVKWPDVLKTAPLSAVSKLKALKERAESLESSQLYEEAAEVYTTLNTEIDKTLKLSVQAPGKWEGMDPEIRRMEKTMEGAEGFSELGGMVNGLRTALQKARQEVSINQDYLAACKLVEGMRKDIAQLKEASESLGKDVGEGKVPSAKFPDATRTVDVKLKTFSKMAGKAIQEVKGKEIKALADKKGDTSTFVSACDEAIEGVENFAVTTLSTFEKAYDRAKEDKKEALLNKVLADIDTEYASVLNRAKQIATRAANVAGDDKELEKSVESATKKKQQAEALQALKDTNDLVLKIKSLHLPDAHAGAAAVKNAVKKVSELRKSANGGTDVNVDAENLKKEMQDLLTRLDGEIDVRQKRAEALAKTLDKKIDQFEKDSPKYAEYFGTVRIKVAVAAGKVSSRLWNVSAQGDLDLQAAETDINNLKNTLKDAEKNFKAVTKKTKALRKAVAELEKKDALAHAKLNHSFENDIVPETLKVLPTEALQKLNDFETGALQTALTKLTDLDEKVANYKKAAKELKKKLKPLEKTVPALYKQLVKRIEDASGSVPGNLDLAHTELGAVELLMDTANEDPENATKLNINAEEEAFEDERRKEEYQAARQLFTDNYGNKAEEFVDKRPDEFKAMKKMRDQADKMIKLKPPDFNGARENLAKAQAMAEFILDNPDDDRSPSGRNLVKLSASWKNRVSTYLKQVSDLNKAIAGATPPPGEDFKADRAKKALQPLLSLFDARAFDPFVTPLAKPQKKGEDINDRRKLKEQALLRVRKYKGTLKDSVMLKFVAGNPISPVALKPMRDTLGGLESELLGS